MQLKMRNERVCVVMPVYNEQAIISHVLKRWADVLDGLGVDYVIRAYNDGSTDSTLQEMRKAAVNLPKVDVRDKRNGGHGNTVLIGYREAVADGFDWIFQVDSDDEMSPEDFEELWSHRCDHDFLVGRREHRKQSWSRKIVSAVSRWCSRVFFGKSVYDVNSPYRLMRVSEFGPFYDTLSKNTFAPNVILSGLAASHCLRCFEIGVPHQDRKTGEVSIRKWKLFKVAVKSFGQTICHAVRVRTDNCLFLGGILLSLVFGIYTICKLNFNSLGWVDEIGTADTAVNIVLHGKWFSHNWPYSYHPLHMWALIPWVKVFGISHVSVCSLNVMWAGLSCMLLVWIMVRRKVFTTYWQVLLFNLLYWFSANLSWTAMSGRIDCMVMFFTVCVVGLFMRKSVADNKGYLVRLGVAAFLLALTGIYTIPLFIVFWLVCVSRPFSQSSRSVIFRRGIVVGIGCFLAFGVVVAYYLYHQALFRYLYMTFCHCTTVSGVSIGSTVGYRECYFTEWHLLVALVVSGILCMMNKEVRHRTNWLFFAFTLFIPPLMVAAGRYAWYYHWVFSIPVGLFLCWSLASLKFKSSVGFIMAIIAACSLNLQINWFLNRISYHKSIPQKEFTELISRNKGRFCSCRDIVVTCHWCYYPSIEAGLNPWVRESQLAHTFLCTTSNRADGLTDKLFSNEEWRTLVKRILARLEKISSARFPEEGFLVAHDASAERVMRDVLIRLDYRVKTIDANGDLRLMCFTRMNQTREQ